MAANVPTVKISSSRHGTFKNVVGAADESHTVEMPIVAMGTAAFSTDHDTAKQALLEAIKAGYRHFDTAYIYGSEKAVGEAIAEALRDGLIASRQEVFVTSKLWCSMAERDMVVPAIRTSLRNLGLEYLDLYLIHTPMRLSPGTRTPPFPMENILPIDLKSVWEGMEECHKLGLTRAIGVSNFSSKRIEEVLRFATIPPAVNQVEMNPMWHTKVLREYCKEKGIHVTAYSVLGANNTVWGDTRIVDCNVLQQIAIARGKTLAQVCLRWAYEQEVSVVVKSYNKERMRENLQIFDWALTDEETKMISSIPQQKGVLYSHYYMGNHELVLQLDAELLEG